MLLDSEGKQYWVTEIYFSPKNFDKICEAINEMNKEEWRDIRTKISQKNAHLKSLSHIQQDITDLTMKITEIEIPE